MSFISIEVGNLFKVPRTVLKFTVKIYPTVKNTSQLQVINQNNFTMIVNKIV